MALVHRAGALAALGDFNPDDNHYYGVNFGTSLPSSGTFLVMVNIRKVAAVMILGRTRPMLASRAAVSNDLPLAINRRVCVTNTSLFLHRYPEQTNQSHK